MAGVGGGWGGSAVRVPGYVAAEVFFYIIKKIKKKFRRLRTGSVDWTSEMLPTPNFLFVGEGVRAVISLTASAAKRCESASVRDGRGRWPDRCRLGGPNAFRACYIPTYIPHILSYICIWYDRCYIYIYIYRPGVVACNSETGAPATRPAGGTLSARGYPSPPRGCAFWFVTSSLRQTFVLMNFKVPQGGGTLSARGDPSRCREAPGGRKGPLAPAARARGRSPGR